MHSISKHQKIQIVNDLLAAPRTKLEAKTRLDQITWSYKIKLATLTHKAYAEPLFDDEKTSSKRAARNEAEREIAVILICADDPEFVQLREQYEAAQREVAYWNDLLKAVDMVSDLSK